MKKIFQNKTVKFVLKTGVSLGFLVYVIFKVDWMAVWVDTQKVSWWQVVMYIAILLIGMAISSYKWKLLAEYKKFKLSHFDYFKYYLAGTFINNFMPSFVGGDAYKAYQVGRSDHRFAEAGSTVMVDRITGLIGAMLLALFFSLVNIKTVMHSHVLIVVNILVLLSFSIDVAIAVMKKSVFWKGIARRFIPEKVLHLIKEIYNFGDNRKILRKSILLAVAFNFVGVALVNYVLFWSLGIHINMLDYLSVIFLTSIVASVPISINNIGIKEWSYIAFFGSVGVASSPVITVAIVSRILQMIVSFFALPIYLKDKLPQGKSFLRIIKK
jgi:glycosyltransferase 2 family protein